MKEMIDLITLILVAFNAFLIILGLYYTLKHYHFNRTWSYIERYNSSDFIETRKFVKVFTNKLESFESKEEKIEYIQSLIKSTKCEDIEINIHISRYVNLFTELGVTYRSRALSKKALISIAPLVVISWESLEPYILVVRKNMKPQEVHNSFEKLYKYITKKGLDKVK